MNTCHKRVIYGGTASDFVAEQLSRSGMTQGRANPSLPRSEFSLRLPARAPGLWRRHAESRCLGPLEAIRVRIMRRLSHVGIEVAVMRQEEKMK